MMIEKEGREFKKINPKDFLVNIAELQNKTQRIYSESTEKMKKFRL